jgi:hypothetical protein
MVESYFKVVPFEIIHFLSSIEIMNQIAQPMRGRSGLVDTEGGPQQSLQPI